MKRRRWWIETGKLARKTDGMVDGWPSRPKSPLATGKIGDGLGGHCEVPCHYSLPPNTRCHFALASADIVHLLKERQKYFPLVTRINGLANCRALKLRSPSIIVHQPRLTYVVNYAKWLQRVVWPRNTPILVPLTPLLTRCTHTHARPCLQRRNISSIKRW